MFLVSFSFSPAIGTANRHALCWPRGPVCHLAWHQMPGTDLEEIMRSCAKWPSQPKTGPPLPKPILTVSLLTDLLGIGGKRQKRKNDAWKIIMWVNAWWESKTARWRDPCLGASSCFLCLAIEFPCDSNRVMACTRTTVSHNTPATLPQFHSVLVPAASERFTDSEIH